MLAILFTSLVRLVPSRFGSSFQRRIARFLTGFVLLNLGIFVLGQGAQNNVSLTELTIETLTTFPYNGKDYRIWKSTRNDGLSSTEWNFRFEPILEPVFDEKTGNLVVAVTPYLGTNWVTRFVLSVKSDVSKALALQKIKEANPDIKITDGSTTVLPMLELFVSIQALATYFPSAKIVKNSSEASGLPNHSTYYVIGGQGIFSQVIEIVSPDKATADKVAAGLPNMTLEFAYSFNSRDSIRNSRAVTWEQLSKSDLYVELFGGGNSSPKATADGNEFVHRNDLRNLSQGIATDVGITDTLEGPQQLDTKVFDKLIEVFKQQVIAAEKSNDKIFESTYHPDDLRPSVVEDFLNKNFTLNTNETHSTLQNR